MLKLEDKRLAYNLSQLNYLSLWNYYAAKLRRRDNVQRLSLRCDAQACDA